jgi:hypothetical protein
VPDLRTDLDNFLAFFEAGEVRRFAGVLALVDFFELTL